MTDEQITEMATKAMQDSPCACRQRDKATCVDLVDAPVIREQMSFITDDAVTFSCEGYCQICQHKQRFCVVIDKGKQCVMTQVWRGA